MLVSLLALTTIFFVWNIRREVEEENDVFYNDTYKKCRKKHKIGFLKTHKCASSTVQNILMRFALHNQLNVVLPTVGNYIGRYVKYNRSMIGSTLWEQANLTYDIFALHTIWEQSEVERTLGENATYITIMRDPVDLFESLWNYANLGNFYKMDLESFALAPKTGILAQRAYRNLGRNQMLWDNGLSSRQMDNPEAVAAKIREIQDKFQLVLIAERFHESIVLMKDLLCWDYRDVVSLKLNARMSQKKSRLSPAAKQALEQYLSADYKLYNHFKAELDKKIKAFGQNRMDTELEILQHANSNIKADCELEEASFDKLPAERRSWGTGLIGYVGNNASNPLCRFIAMAENSFIDLLRVKQAARAREVLGDEPDNPYAVEEDERFRDLPRDKIDVDKLRAMLNP